MELGTADAIAWTKRLVGAAIALQSLELLLVREAWSERGVFRWSVLRREFLASPRPLRSLLDAALGERSFFALLGLQLAAAVSLPWVEGAWPARLLLVTTWFVCVRFRGTYNGGSDAMTWVVLFGLVVAELSPALERAGLAYIAAQLVLSYFVAGVSKWREPSWRRGDALAVLLRAPQYEAPEWVRRYAGQRAGAIACVFVLAFECAFPLALSARACCLVLCALGFAFHLANTLVLGLNRFVWAWLAAYPALLFWSQRERWP